MANQGPFQIVRISPTGYSLPVQSGMASDQIAITTARQKKRNDPSNNYVVKDKNGAVIFQT